MKGGTMEPSTKTQLRRQLQVLEEFDRKNAPNRLSLWGYWIELLAGVGLLGQLVVVQMPNRPNWLGWTFLTLALVLIVHALYLLFRYSLDKRVQLILRALLSIEDTPPVEETPQVKRQSPVRRVRRKKR